MYSVVTKGTRRNGHASRKPCHLLKLNSLYLSLHAYGLTFMPGCGGDGGGVTGDEAGKPVTIVQDCASTFVQQV